MSQKINQLLEQKHLLCEIDLFIYSNFLKENEINQLVKTFNSEDSDLENFLNLLPKMAKKFNKDSFDKYISLREKILDKEKEIYKIIKDRMKNLNNFSDSHLT